MTTALTALAEKLKKASRSSILTSAPNYRAINGTLAARCTESLDGTVYYLKGIDWEDFTDMELYHCDQMLMREATRHADDLRNSIAMERNYRRC